MNPTLELSHGGQRSWQVCFWLKHVCLRDGCCGTQGQQLAIGESWRRWVRNWAQRSVMVIGSSTAGPDLGLGDGRLGPHKCRGRSWRVAGRSLPGRIATRQCVHVDCRLDEFLGECLGPRRRKKPPIAKVRVVGRRGDQRDQESGSAEKREALQGSAADSQWLQDHCRSGRKHLRRCRNGPAGGPRYFSTGWKSLPTAKIGRFPPSTSPYAQVG